MADDLREKIAEVLAGHARPYTGSQSCECGVVFRWTGYDSETVWAHRRHVAEAILAAIGDRVLPEGGETHEERGVVHDDLGEFHRCTAWATCTQWFPHVHGHTHTVTTWPDGTTLTGPWRPVDTEDPRRALTEGQADG